MTAQLLKTFLIYSAFGLGIGLCLGLGYSLFQSSNAGGGIAAVVAAILLLAFFVFIAHQIRNTH